MVFVEGRRSIILNGMAGKALERKGTFRPRPGGEEVNDTGVVGDTKC